MLQQTRDKFKQAGLFLHGDLMFWLLKENCALDRIRSPD
jgi:hypothetical protein